MGAQAGDDKICVLSFGRRKIAPHACIADAREHVRGFLCEALEELGFVTCESAGADELAATVDERHDLVVIALSAGGLGAADMLKVLAARNFDGKVLLIGPHDSLVVFAVQELGEKLGLAMLPVLETPYRDETLRERVGKLIPRGMLASAPVDVGQALRAGWLELWYQPKVEARTLEPRGAEALVRMRHPHWGIVTPAGFIPVEDDPHFHALSEFILRRAAADWHLFLAESAPVELAINLSMTFLGGAESIAVLTRELPEHAAFRGLIVEVDGAEVIHDPALAKRIAKQLRFHDIGVSIDDVGAEWPSLFQGPDFPFVEIKVDRALVAGCADDRTKQRICRQIVERAHGVGARTVAEGVESKGDFHAVRDIGFDLVQGFLFAKPMGARKFARTFLRRHARAPQ